MNTVKNKQILCILFALLALLSLTGCGSRGSTTLPDCPFSDLKWASSVKDMEKIEGKEHETYDSVYGGTTYTYPKEYEGVTGTVKYMFDDKNRLACIAWAYSSENTDELYRLYEKIHGDMEAVHGDSGYNTNKATNYGDVWYLDEGNIIISTMVTESQKALQFAFLSPEQSTAQEDVYRSDTPDLIQ